jgi:type III pantothenate kinase
MYLAIDQGNTSTKIGVGDASGLVQRWTYEPGGETYLADLVERYDVQKAIISSVAKEENRSWIAELEKKIPLVRLQADTPNPLQNKYHTPATLGYDRLADAVGAWKLFPGEASLVIDMGTCINYEFVTAKAEYLGGAISPGMQMRFKALHHFTGKLPLIDEHFQPETFVGVDTTTSLLSGVMNGILQEVDGVIGQYRQQYGPVNVVLTGGDADYFGKYLKNQTFAQPGLVLLGLLEILLFIDEHHSV